MKKFIFSFFVVFVSLSNLFSMDSGLLFYKEKFIKSWNDFTENYSDFNQWKQNEEDEKLIERFDLIQAKMKDIFNEGLKKVSFKEQGRYFLHNEISVIAGDDPVFITVRKFRKNRRLLKEFKDIVTDWVNFDFNNQVHPLWHERIVFDPITGKPKVEINDPKAYQPKTFNNESMLKFIEKLQKIEPVDQKVIGITFSNFIEDNNVGFFMGSYLLKKKIDDQISSGINIDDIKISVEEVVWRLYRQRPFTIVDSYQFIRLNRFVDYYIDLLKNK